MLPKFFTFGRRADKAPEAAEIDMQRCDQSSSQKMLERELNTLPPLSD